MVIPRIILLTAALLAAPSLAPTMAAGAEVTVFAAASLTESMTAAAEAYAAETGTTVAVSFASSSSLARQIENGAPADVFVSANADWMDRLDSAGLLVPESRVNLLRNRLALVAPTDAVGKSIVDAGLDLSRLLGDGRLAVGDPDHVPAGHYARAALQSLGLWRVAEPRLARAGNVRAALVLVARGEVPLGIVYATDAAASDRVDIVGLFPADSHPPIVYPAALTLGAGDAAGAFLRYLTGAEARRIFVAHGFEIFVEAPGDRPS